MLPIVDNKNVIKNFVAFDIEQKCEEPSAISESQLKDIEIELDFHKLFEKPLAGMMSYDDVLRQVFTDFFIIKNTENKSDHYFWNFTVDRKKILIGSRNSFKHIRDFISFITVGYIEIEKSISELPGDKLNAQDLFKNITTNWFAKYESTQKDIFGAIVLIIDSENRNIESFSHNFSILIPSTFQTDKNQTNDIKKNQQININFNDNFQFYMLSADFSLLSKTNLKNLIENVYNLPESNIEIYKEKTQNLISTQEDLSENLLLIGIQL